MVDVHRPIWNKNRKAIRKMHARTHGENKTVSFFAAQLASRAQAIGLGGERKKSRNMCTTLLPRKQHSFAYDRSRGTDHAAMGFFCLTMPFSNSQQFTIVTVGKNGKQRLSIRALEDTRAVRVVIDKCSATRRVIINSIRLRYCGPTGACVVCIFEPLAIPTSDSFFLLERERR